MGVNVDAEEIRDAINYLKTYQIQSSPTLKFLTEQTIRVT